VLLANARSISARIRDIAAACRITERTAQNVVSDLNEAGYLHRQRTGRRKPGLFGGIWCAHSVTRY
jgi:hypothetical protein